MNQILMLNPMAKMPREMKAEAISESRADGNVKVVWAKMPMYGFVYEHIRLSIEAANADPTVSAILIDMDTPGGYTSECAETAETIRASKKPVIAYVAGEACSAGYWLAAACHKIVAHRSAFVGSIGTYCYIPGEDDEVIVVSSLSPDKVPNAQDEASVAKVRAHLDEMTTMFINDLAKYRGVEAEKILADWGRGDIVKAESALQLGMIDAVGNFRDAWSLARKMAGTSAPRTDNAQSLSAKRTTSAPKGDRMAKTAKFLAVSGSWMQAAAEAMPSETDGGEEITLDFIKQNYPEIADALREEGKKEQSQEAEAVEEMASLADPSDEEEAAVVAQARAGKMKAAEIPKKLAELRKARAASGDNKRKELLRSTQAESLPSNILLLSSHNPNVSRAEAAGQQITAELKRLRAGGRNG